MHKGQRSDQCERNPDRIGSAVYLGLSNKQVWYYTYLYRCLIFWALWAVLCPILPMHSFVPTIPDFPKFSSFSKVLKRMFSAPFSTLLRKPDVVKPKRLQNYDQACDSTSNDSCRSEKDRGTNLHLRNKFPEHRWIIQGRLYATGKKRYRKMSIASSLRDETYICDYFYELILGHLNYSSKDVDGKLYRPSCPP